MLPKSNQRLLSGAVSIWKTDMIEKRGVGEGWVVFGTPRVHASRKCWLILLFLDEAHMHHLFPNYHSL